MIVTSLYSACTILEQNIFRTCTFNIGSRTFARVNKNSSAFKLYEILLTGEKIYIIKLRPLHDYYSDPGPLWAERFIEAAKISERDLEIFLVTYRISGDKLISIGG